MAKQSNRAKVQENLQRPLSTAEQQADEARKAAEAAQARAEAPLHQPTDEELEVAEKDELYRKALHEIDGYTLVPEAKVKANHTVEQESDKLYPGGMVIAKRL